MRCALTLVVSFAATTSSLRTPNSSKFNRRNAMAVAAAAALPMAVAGQPAEAADAPLKVYFCAGCFWHVQHEFTMEEMATLKRSSTQMSAVSGYAGGQRLGDGGKVCYHNPRGIADYGKLGHAEAVQVEIPTKQLPAFAKRYFALFGERGYRHDPQDRGGEYRSVLGLPGGADSPYMDVIKEVAARSPMKLQVGRGDEPDTIGDRLVLVYDSNKFPFYPAELYHQFHNDFMGPPYGRAYNEINSQLYKSGVLKTTGCPDYI